MKTLTLADLPKLKRELNKAIKNHKDSFMFKNQEILVLYAKYVIEYLNTLKK